MPRIAPHVERCVDALRRGDPLPKPPLPPTGSTRDLRSFAAAHNCSTFMRNDELYHCMLMRLEPQLRHPRARGRRAPPAPTERAVR
mmetsp:Transcript_11524/g.35589  ORF Transcript_11524/g.35589 Transcript_11524/m.35589 type:complete len:86 (-) Transcript_11524:982-1239(-)